jgi:hypothetical protein
VPIKNYQTQDKKDGDYKPNHHQRQDHQELPGLELVSLVQSEVLVKLLNRLQDKLNLDLLEVSLYRPLDLILELSHRLLQYAADHQ